MSVDAVNLAAANKRHGIVNTGEIVEGIPGLGNPLIPLEGQIIDLSDYPELYKQRTTFEDNILYPNSVIDVHIGHISNLASATYHYALPATIGIFQAREPELLVVMPMYRADYNETQLSNFSFYKINKYTHEIVQVINFATGLGSRGIVCCGYAYIGTTEYVSLRVGNTTPDSYIFYTTNNFSSTTRGDYPTTWFNSTLAAIDDTVVNFISGKLSSTTPVVVESKCSTQNLLVGNNRSIILPPQFANYLIGNYTAQWKGLVIGIITYPGKISAVVAASATQELVNITNNMAASEGISGIAGSDKVLIAVTNRGEIWYTEKFDSIQTQWVQALNPIATKINSAIAISDYEFFICGDNYSFFFNIKTKQIRFVECAMQRGYVDNRVPGYPVIHGFAPGRYGWGVVTVRVRDGQQGTSYLTKTKQINNFDNFNPAGGGLIFGCRGRDNALVQLFTPSPNKSLKDTVNTAKILISTDGGKSYDVRFFREKLSGNEIHEVYSLQYFNNKYYAFAVHVGNLVGIYSSTDLITWTLVLSYSNAFCSAAAVANDGTKLYYHIYNRTTATTEVYSFNGTTHTKIFSEAFSTFDNITSIAANGQFIAVNSKKKVIYSLNGGSTWVAAATWATVTEGSIIYDPQYNRMVAITSYQGLSIVKIESNGTGSIITQTFPTGMPVTSVQRVFIQKDKIYCNGVFGGFGYIDRNIQPTSKIYQLATPFDNISNQWYCYTSIVDPLADNFIITSYKSSSSTSALVYELKLRTLEDDLYLNKAILGWSKIGGIEDMSPNMVFIDRFNISKDGNIATSSAQWNNQNLDLTTVWNGGVSINQPASYSPSSFTVNGNTIYAPEKGSAVDNKFTRYYATNGSYYHSFIASDRTNGMIADLNLIKIPVLGENPITINIPSPTDYPLYLDYCAGVSVLYNIRTKTVFHDSGTGGVTWAGSYAQANFGFNATDGGINNIAFGKNTVIAMSSLGEISYALNDFLSATWKLIPNTSTLFEYQSAQSWLTPKISFVNGIFTTYSSLLHSENRFTGWVVPSTHKSTIIASYDGSNFTPITQIDGRINTPPCAFGDYFAMIGVQQYNDATPSHLFTKDLITWFPTIFKENYNWTAITSRPIYKDHSCRRNNNTSKYTIVSSTGEIYDNDLDPNTMGRRWKELDEDLFPEAMGTILFSTTTNKYYGVGLRSGKIYSTSNIEDPMWVGYNSGTMPVVSGSPGVAIIYTIINKRYIIPKVYNIVDNPTLAIFDITTNQFLNVVVPGNWIDVHEIHYINTLQKWIVVVNIAGGIPKVYSSSDLLTFTEITTLPGGLSLFDAGATDDTYFISNYYSTDLITWKQWRYNTTAFSLKNTTEYNMMGKYLLIADRTGQVWRTDSSGDLINMSINRDTRYATPQSGRIYSHSLTGYSEFDNIGLVWYNGTILFSTDGVYFYETGVPMELTSYILSVTTDGQRIITTLSDGTVCISKQFINNDMPDRVTIPCISHPHIDKQYYIYSGK